ncbi:FbpB family small basic protein [Bacillus sp. ISL-47]|nr:FbpB family small basic protein [Bacillus sp. ISL-47]MBT2687152.1 FbpB family small basic protein [Bacillus sp. ISL-47]MBT2709751.1 FbpB family small basic protein [Pseudomonas sp. ISL-84]
MKKKIRYTMDELIKRNKEELLKDKIHLEKIERKLDEKYMKVKPM